MSTTPIQSLPAPRSVVAYLTCRVQLCPTVRRASLGDLNGMKLTPWYLAALAPIAIAGCSGALMGHVAVLALAIGIFVGTLSLGRDRSTASSSAQAVTTQVQASADKNV